MQLMWSKNNFKFLSFSELICIINILRLEASIFILRRATNALQYLNL